jgi:PhnB protein
VAAKKKAIKKSAPKQATKAQAKSKPKAKKVQPIPAGYHSVTSYLVVRGLAQLLPFLEKAISIKVKHKFASPDGVVHHAEIKFGDSMIMLGEARPGQETHGSMLYLYVKDTDKLYHQAIKAGGESVMAPANQFYGDRNAGFKDPCGNQWFIATHVEDVPPKEMARRMAAAKAHN